MSEADPISSRDYLRLMREMLSPFKAKLLLFAALLFVSTGLQLLNPQILRAFIDAAREGREASHLMALATWFIGIAFTAQLFTALSTWRGSDLGWSATNRLREKLIRHVLGLDLSFHGAKTSGELIERIDGDVSALSRFFSHLFLQMLNGVLLATGVVFLLFRESRALGLALAILAVLSVFVLSRIRHLGMKQQVIQRKASSRLFGFLEERLAGIDDLRSNGASDYVLDGFYRANHHFFHTTRWAWFLRVIIFEIIIFIFHSAQLIALGVGVWLFMQDAISLGTVFLFFQYTLMLKEPIERITRQIQELQRASASITRIRDLLEESSEVTDGDGISLPAEALDVSFENVSFAYREDTPVVRDLSFTLGPGRVLGLLGRTGSGKTTLTRLLFRLYDPASGTVRVNGHNLRDAGVRELRKHFAMVTQDVQVFDASIRDNLRFFDPAVSDERILEVIGQLGLRAWYDEFPDGLDTMLHGGARGLSAGEAQLIAFTRVFLRDPGLVVLDEPSSRMDPHTESLVRRAMRELLENRSAIIIAHRLGTVREVDDVLILEQGRVREFGERATLEQDDTSRFAELLRTGLEEATA